jgi:hypothetical protein
MADVKITRESFLMWLVWLDCSVIASFDSVLEALDFASLLECDPRFRREAEEISAPAS